MTHKVHQHANGFFALENVYIAGSVCPFVVLCDATGKVVKAFAKTLRGHRAPTNGQLNALRGYALAFYLTETEAGRAEYAAAVAAVAA